MTAPASNAEPGEPGPGVIAFLTDYGTRDGFVGVCHGVIARIAPRVRILDISHDVPPQDVRHGAAVLARAVPFLPPAVCLGVVDPGVGTSRHGVAARAGGFLLVGPDNGLLVRAAEVLGGVEELRVLTNPALWLPAVGPTFHGRDVFAPVAAYLAAGGDLAEVGDPLSADSLVRLPAPRCEVAAGAVAAEVTYVNTYGTVQLAAGADELAGLAARSAQGVVDIGTSAGDHRATVGRTFGDVSPGDLVLYEDSDRRVAIAVNGGSAATRLGVGAGDLVVLRGSRAPRKSR